MDEGRSLLKKVGYTRRIYGILVAAARKKE
jgi:hypothetical protein